MEQTMHIAAQYLATSAISFIKKEDDDSHTNLGWKNHTLETHPFPNGDKLGLNYEDFSLEWMSSEDPKERLLLDNLTHKEITDWISMISTKNKIEKQYAFNLHYELPYKQLSNYSRIQLTSRNDLNKLIENRDLAEHVISNILKSNNYESPIRIWPHHFDTGALINVNEELSIGIGMTIPDSIIDDFYFYVSGYKGHDPIEIETSSDVNSEAYYNNDWQGFAMAVSKLNKQSAIKFCQDAMETYIKSVN